MRVRRSLLNFASMLLYLSVSTALALAATPLLQERLGGRRFGASRVVLDAYGYLSLLELGLGGALVPLLARAAGRGDAAALGSAVSAGARRYLRVSAWTVAVGLVLTPVVPRFAQGLNAAEVADLRRAWVCGLATFLSLALLPLRSVVEVRQRGYVVNLLLTAQVVFSTWLSLRLARDGWGITGQAVSFAAAAWAFNLALAAGVFWTRPGLVRSALTTRPDAETLASLRALGGPSLVLNVCGRVSVLSDYLIVGFALDTRRVTSLYNTQRLANLGQLVLLGAVNAAWAGLAELHAQGHRETFNRRLVELTRLIAVVAVAGLTPVVAYNRAFVRLWLGLDGPNFTYAGDAVIALASVNALLLAVQALWVWCFTASGRVRDVTGFVIAAAVFNVVASVTLTYKLGVVGTLLGSTLAMAFGTQGPLTARLHGLFGTPARALTWAVVGPLAWGVCGASALWTFTHFGREPSGWVALGFEMTVASVASLAGSVVFLLPRDERRLWRDRLRALCPARKAPAVSGAS